MALDYKKIFQYLSEECNLIFLDAHQSSNEFFKEHEASDLIDVCVVKKQLVEMVSTAGNGYRMKERVLLSQLELNIPLKDQ